MLLEGSCHCRAVSFQVHARHAHPYNLCYCDICRKTAGGGGFAINLGGEYATLQVQGKEHLRVYRARLYEDDGSASGESPAQRNFCGECGSALWVWDPRWPELIHPFASAIDTPLPTPPERNHMMLASRPAWVGLNTGPADRRFDAYPDESLAAWHQRLGLESD